MKIPENNNDAYKLTFSQREGKTSLPEPMQLEHVPRKFKQLIFLAIEQTINDQSRNYNKHYKIMNNSMERILFDYRHDVQGLLASDARHEWWHGIGDASEDKRWVEELLKEAEYHDALSFVEFIMRHAKCPKKLHNDIRAAFEHVPMAYFVRNVNGLLTVIPQFSGESGEAIQQAIESIEQAEMEGATAHLSEAVKHINEQQYADSISDSILAVESVARTIDPEAKNTLGPALKSLKKAGVINHPALIEAFSKLYGYTNDEQGIRHALLNNDSPDVGLDEAMFMFGACASFAAYLVNKHRQMEQQKRK